LSGCAGIGANREKSRPAGAARFTVILAELYTLQQAQGTLRMGEVLEIFAEMCRIPAGPAEILCLWVLSSAGSFRAI
jgi:hypothetical protein